MYTIYRIVCQPRVITISYFLTDVLRALQHNYNLRPEVGVIVAFLSAAILADG